MNFYGQTMLNVGTNPSVSMEWKTIGEPMDVQLLYGHGIRNSIASTQWHYAPQTKSLIYTCFREFSLVQVKNWDKSPNNSPLAQQNACDYDVSSWEKGYDITEETVQ